MRLLLTYWRRLTDHLSLSSILMPCRNSKIIAESWLDEYKYLFYTLRPAAKRIPLNLSLEQYQLDLIKTEQQCHRFDWYMRHVNTQLK